MLFSIISQLANHLHDAAIMIAKYWRRHAAKLYRERLKKAYLMIYMFVFIHCFQMTGLFIPVLLCDLCVVAVSRSVSSQGKSSILTDSSPKLADLSEATKLAICRFQKRMRR